MRGSQPEPCVTQNLTHFSPTQPTTPTPPPLPHPILLPLNSDLQSLLSNYRVTEKEGDTK
jgi:hypothetical protein